MIYFLLFKGGQFINMLFFMTLVQLSYNYPESPTPENYKFQHLILKF